MIPVYVCVCGCFYCCCHLYWKKIVVLTRRPNTQTIGQPTATSCCCCCFLYCLGDEITHSEKLILILIYWILFGPTWLTGWLAEWLTWQDQPQLYIYIYLLFADDDDGLQLKIDITTTKCWWRRQPKFWVYVCVIYGSSSNLNLDQKIRRLVVSFSSYFKNFFSFLFFCLKTPFMKTLQIFFLSASENRFVIVFNCQIIGFSLLLLLWNLLSWKIEFSFKKNDQSLNRWHTIIGGGCELDIDQTNCLIE